MITTTLNRIKQAGVLGKASYAQLLGSLGKAEADDEALPFSKILEINGLEDALRCCKAEPQYAPEWRLFMVWCARRVEHLMTNQHSRDALNVAERHANGQATDEELEKAAAAYAAYAASSRAVWPPSATAAAYAAALAAVWPPEAAAAWTAFAAIAAAAATVVSNDEIAAQTAEFLRIVTETEARE